MARGANPVGTIATAAAVALVGWLIWARYPAVRTAIKNAIADIGGAAPQWVARTVTLPGSPTPVSIPAGIAPKPGECYHYTVPGLFPGDPPQDRQVCYGGNG